MKFESYIGYRFTGRVFINRVENAAAVNVFRALLRQGQDKQAYYDTDNQEQHTEIAVVVDTILCGADAEILYNLIKESTGKATRVSTISITPNDTMLPRLYYFGHGRYINKHQVKLSMFHVSQCLKQHGGDLAYVKGILSVLLEANNKDYLTNIIATIKEGTREHKNDHDIQRDG